ncbi:MAG: uncharacterized phosphatase [Candidatus Desulfovibrio kirbyi]|uniref:phosphoglycolate phosphatase n=1 Tax=Candidatus Desulfovibrio kirbyi TaxID=2696086 RepID=A0A6L2R3X1_9BACT|nr:MAG: uncharacterized phosphatase [Candidatus Desulfovibrio kirbyi]
MALRCIAFDCDGVLLDSVPIKTNAFARLAEPYGKEATDRFVMYHTVHGGVSRYKKFEWFFSEIVGRGITPEESREWGERFARYVLNEVRCCALVPGVREVLDKWRGKVPLYVCSGAPQAELHFVLRERGLAEYFVDIFGSPPAKHRVLAELVQKAGVLPEQTLMVGDALTDFNAALAVGTRFYGVGPELEGGGYPWGQDLMRLNAWIEANV